MSPSPTLGPGLASRSPRTSTAVPLGRPSSEASRGMPSRYFSSGRLLAAGSAPSNVRIHCTMSGFCAGIENLPICLAHPPIGGTRIYAIFPGPNSRPRSPVRIAKGPGNRRGGQWPRSEAIDSGRRRGLGEVRANLCSFENSNDRIRNSNAKHGKIAVPHLPASGSSQSCGSVAGGRGGPRRRPPGGPNPRTTRIFDGRATEHDIKFAANSPMLEFASGLKSTSTRSRSPGFGRSLKMLSWALPANPRMNNCVVSSSFVPRFTFTWICGCRPAGIRNRLDRAEAILAGRTGLKAAEALEVIIARAFFEPLSAVCRYTALASHCQISTVTFRAGSPFSSKMRPVNS